MSSTKSTTKTTKTKPRDVDPDIAGSAKAILRAAKRARERALRFGHTIVVYVDGQIKEIDPRNAALPPLPAKKRGKSRP